MIEKIIAQALNTTSISKFYVGTAPETAQSYGVVRCVGAMRPFTVALNQKQLQIMIADTSYTKAQAVADAAREFLVSYRGKVQEVVVDNITISGCYGVNENTKEYVVLSVNITYYEVE